MDPFRVPALVTVPGGIPTGGDAVDLGASPLPYDSAAGLAMTGSRQRFALRRSQFPSLPQGTVIRAGIAGQPEQDWIVDLELERDAERIIVVVH